MVLSGTHFWVRFVLQIRVLRPVQWHRASRLAMKFGKVQSKLCADLLSCKVNSEKFDKLQCLLFCEQQLEIDFWEHPDNAGR